MNQPSTGSTRIFWGFHRISGIFFLGGGENFSIFSVAKICGRGIHLSVSAGVSITFGAHYQRDVLIFWKTKIPFINYSSDFIWIKFIKINLKLFEFFADLIWFLIEFQSLFKLFFPITFKNDFDFNLDLMTLKFK